MKRILLVLMVGLLVVSCNKEQAIAPALTFDGEANYTIRQLLDNAGTDSLTGKVICGTVVSSDEAGAFYKILVIQDETAGIQLKLSGKNLFMRYKIGQKVYVKLDGMVLGSYHNLPQLGMGDPSNVVAIPNSLETRAIFRDDLPGPEPAPFIIDKNTVTAADLDDHLNMLVEIPECEFASGAVGQTFVVGTGPYTPTNLAFKVDGKTIAVNTSKYVDASIGKAIVPNGTGTLRGVLTVYVTDDIKYQIVLRTIKDVQWAVMPSEESAVVYDITQHNSEDLYGWSQVSNNADWIKFSSSGRFGFQLNGNSSTDSWVISPSFNFAGLNNLILSFSRMNDVQLYYTTSNYSAGSPIVDANWTKIELPAAGGSIEAHQVNLPQSAKHIAFRSTGITGVSAAFNIKITSDVSK